MAQKKNIVKWAVSLCSAFLAMVSCVALAFGGFTKVTAESSDAVVKCVDVTTTADKGSGYLTTVDYFDMTKENAELVMEFTTGSTFTLGDKGVVINNYDVTSGNWLVASDGSKGETLGAGTMYGTSLFGVNRTIRIIMTNGKVYFTRVKDGSASNDNSFSATSYKYGSEWLYTSAKNITDFSRVRIGMQSNRGTGSNSIWNLDNFRIYYNGVAQELKYTGGTQMTFTPDELPADDLWRTVSVKTLNVGAGYITSAEIVDLSQGSNNEMTMEFDAISASNSGLNVTADLLQFPTNGGALNYNYATTPDEGYLGQCGIATGKSYRFVLSYQTLNVYEKAFGEETYTLTTTKDYSAKEWDWSNIRIALQKDKNSMIELENFSIGVNGRKTLLEWSGNLANPANTSVSKDGAGIMMTAGAAVRIASAQTSGLRFETYFDRADMDKLMAREDVVSVSYGTLITAADYLVNDIDFTVESLETNDVLYLNIVASGFHTKSTADAYLIYGSIVDLKTYNYDRDFAGRSYVKVVYDDGRVVYFYSYFSMEDNVRNIEYVANAAINDRSDVKTDVYQYETAEGNYSRYDETGMTVLKGFIGEE